MSHNKKDNTPPPPLPLAGEGRGEGSWLNKRHKQVKRAKSLRQNSTNAENLLWQKIRNRQISDCKFKRQFPLGPYIADFVCIEKMLIIEVDGGQHSESDRNKARTEYLKKKGYEVIRFWNNEVLGNIAGVLQALTLTLSRKREREYAANKVQDFQLDEGVAPQKRRSGAADFVGHPHPISPAKRERSYLSQCIAGLQEFIAEQLVRDFNANIEHVEEGLVVFSAGKVENSAHINNLFLILHVPKGRDMEALLTACTRETHWHTTARQSVSKSEQTFRLFLSDENKLVSADRAKLGKLISQIEQQCRLEHSSHRPDTEFWLFRRRNGAAYLCKRLTKNRVTEKDLKPGELRPELAHILCLISEPEAQDVFLDPFAGSGAIAITRKTWPFKTLLASDISSGKAQALKKKIPNANSFIIRAADALQLNNIADGSIDKVVTDPPWGFFDKNIKDIPAFYKKALQELCRVVKPDGLIVMLTGQRELAGDLAKQFSDRLTLERRYDILVSGKKASIMKWRKTDVA